MIQGKVDVEGGKKQPYYIGIFRHFALSFVCIITFGFGQRISKTKPLQEVLNIGPT